MAENKYASYMQIVESLGADISFFGPDYSKIYQVDHRLRLFFYAGSVYSRFLEVFQHHTAPDKLIRVQDSFHVCYYFYKTPTLSSDGKLYFCIGPILHEDISEKMLSNILNKNHIPDSLRAELYRFYNQIPIPANPSVFESTLLAVTQALFGEKLSFTTLPSDYLRVPESGAGADDSRHFTDTIENIYRLENAMMDAIAIGDEASALDYYDLEMKLTFRPRPVNPLHSKISGIIVFNTLCRKAIEKGGVHPIYIDEISRRYSIEINNATSTGALDGIQTRIIHDYCELVKAQAHPGYSELIRNCLLYISQHITEKMMLSKIAEALEVSVFEFLDIEVKSVNDIISLVNKMNIATDIDWDIDNDKVCISFKNKEINNCLKEYAVDYKKDNILIEKTETNYESTLTRLMLINDKLR